MSFWVVGCPLILAVLELFSVGLSLTCQITCLVNDVQSAPMKYWVPQGFGPWTQSVHHVHQTSGLCYPAVRYHLPIFCLWFSCTFRVSSLVSSMTSSIEGGVWTKGNKLKMNDDKTELITIGSKSKLKQVSTSSVVFQNCETAFSESVQNLGVFLDKSLSVEIQVNQLCKVLCFQLYRISKIRSFLTVDATNTLAVDFILFTKHLL